MDSIVIIGTGGFALELSGLLSDVGIKIKGFIGPKPTRKLPELWLGNDDYLNEMPQASIVLIAIGSPKIRSKLVQKIRNKKIKQYTFVHPESYIGSDVIIEEGSIIYPNVTIHAGVIVRKNVLVNSNATIGHETIVGELTNIGPGSSIGGCCKIGRETYIGIGSSIIEKVTIGKDVLIGAGASVVSNIITPGIYVGVPAKKINK
jgi:sugar O-acyltransferase (sialic acid O-acetyltransferase NeuD family)